MRVRPLLLALIIIVLSLFLISCQQEPVTIESITISRSIGEDSAPVDPTNEFASGTSIIYISVKVENMTPEDKLTVTWNYLETGSEIDTPYFSPDKKGSGYIGFNLKVGQSLPNGDYNALVYLNDELYETMEFLVK